MHFITLNKRYFISFDFSFYFFPIFDISQYERISSLEFEIAVYKIIIKRMGHPISKTSLFYNNIDKGFENFSFNSFGSVVSKMLHLFYSNSNKCMIRTTAETKSKLWLERSRCFSWSDVSIKWIYLEIILVWSNNESNVILWDGSKEAVR